MTQLVKVLYVPIGGDTLSEFGTAVVGVGVSIAQSGSVQMKGAAVGMVGEGLDEKMGESGGVGNGSGGDEGERGEDREGERVEEGKWVGEGGKRSEARDWDEIEIGGEEGEKEGEEGVGVVGQLAEGMAVVAGDGDGIG